MPLCAGIVGLPNVGKSTIFNVLTKANAPCSNYPFTTVSPNVGVCVVPDERLLKIAQIIPHKEIIPATIEVIDIAGLVKDAHKGEGLGNRFLSHIREVDAILHIVRLFKNPDVVHISGDVNPKWDILTVENELLFADLESVEKRLEKVEKIAKAGDKEAVELVEILEKLKIHLEEGVQVRAIPVKEKEKEMVESFSLLTSKPVLYVVNIDESEDWAGSPEFKDITELAKRNNDRIVEISAKLELELLELSEEEREEFKKDFGLKENSVDKLIKEVYQLLGFITFFTIQSQIIQAWPILSGIKAMEAAGKIHSDFEKGFISAEVLSIEDLLQFRNEGSLRSGGKIKMEGRDYIVRDGDIIRFRFNV